MEGIDALSAGTAVRGSTLVCSLVRAAGVKAVTLSTLVCSWPEEAEGTEGAMDRFAVLSGLLVEWREEVVS